MNHIPSSILKLWSHICIHGRLAGSVVIGVLSYLMLLLTPIEPTLRALITWDIGAGLYLVLAWHLFARTSIEQMKRRASLQDDGAMLVLFLTVAAAMASVAAIVMVLWGLEKIPLEERQLRLALVVVTFLASWLLVHTSFALHYAHAYYGPRSESVEPALAFPGREPPAYMDFMYFAIVIGMTSQTADVGLATTRMRRLVMVQGLIAFAFNTTLLALTVNIAASLLNDPALFTALPAAR